MDQAVQFAPAGKPVHYERRHPEETVLYQLVQEHLETFFAQVERETGAGLPDFVKEEVDAFLECGILAHGFLRLRCADCAHEKLVAFSCKKRGFCPACGSRRMAETAAHLVDCVIPRFGLCSLWIAPSRRKKVSVVFRPSTFQRFHDALVKCKYRLLFSAKGRGKPGPEGSDRR